MSETVVNAPAKTKSATDTPPARKRAPLGSRLVDWLKAHSAAAILMVAILVIWELIVVLGKIPPYLLPAPTSIVSALYEGFASGIFWIHTWVTLQEILGGFIIAVALSFVLAFLVTRWDWAERAVMPLIIAFQTVPKLALAPLVLVWFGFGIESKLITTALVAFFPLLINIIAGIQSVDRERLDMFKAWGASDWQVFKRLKLPTALPYIFAGLDIAVVFCVIGAIVAEFVGAQQGLGYLIQTTTTSLDVATTFAVLVILSVFGLVMHWVIESISHRVVFWQGKGLNAISGR